MGHTPKIPESLPIKGQTMTLSEVKFRKATR